MKRSHNSLIPLLALLLLSCGEEADTPVLARVGDETITAGDFKISYELTPRFFGTKAGAEPRRSHLEWMVNERLLAREAEQRGLHQDETIVLMLDWKRKTESIKELYRQEVRDKVEPSDSELREAFSRLNQEIRAQHLFFEDEASALREYGKLLAGEVTVAELAAWTFTDSTLAANAGDLGFFSWGEMEPEFEAAAYGLRPSQLSTPIRTKWGFHIIRVIDRRENLLLTEQEFACRRNYLRKTMTKQKRDALASQYIQRFMTPKQVRMKGPAFALLCEIFVAKNPEPEKDFPQVTPRLQEQGAADAQRLSAVKHEPLITFIGGAWTIADFLDIVRSLPVNERPRVNHRTNFENDIGVLVRDHFLAREASRRGLEETRVVRKEVAKWRTKILAQEMWRQARTHAEINSANEEQVRRASEAQINDLLARLKREVVVTIDKQALAAIETVDRGSAREIEVMAVPATN